MQRRTVLARAHARFGSCLALVSALFVFSSVAFAARDLEATDPNWSIRHYEPVAPVERQMSQRDTVPDGDEVIMVSFAALGRQFEIEMTPNPNLPSSTDGIRFQAFRGRLVGNDSSWARLTRTEGAWSGVVWDGVELFMLDRVEDVEGVFSEGHSLAEGETVLYRLTDAEPHEELECAAEGGHASFGFDGDAESLLGNAPRANLGEGGSLLLTVLADPLFVEANGDRTEAAVVSRMNVVDGIYSEQVGVQLRLLPVVRLATNRGFESRDPNRLLDQLENHLVQGRARQLGLVHLFTGRDLFGRTVGIANVAVLCDGRSGVGLSEVRGEGTLGALTVAHELGHNFGARHDNQSGSPCASTPGRFIMNPRLGGGDRFSQCSLDHMAPQVMRAQCVIPRCGLGFELAGVIPLVQWVRRRRRSTM